MKAIIKKIGGKTYYLTYTGEALFTITEKYETIEKVMELVTPETREAFKILCDVISILATQGELARRYYGYDPGEILEAETLEKTMLQPYDIFDLKGAIPRTVTLGYTTEIEPDADDEIDLSLIELNQKKTV